ncbi:MAG TPA: CDP-glucose 4,6-dehydratase [Acidimicrobiales bacterium]|nr:CDP-glucose 4,6-dehydratase [Acidimicrobiales bacterium]
MEEWRGRRVLVTGDSGFKGTWLALWLQQLGATVVGVSLPPVDDRCINVAIGASDLFEHHDVDVRDADAVARVVGRIEPDFVFHLAAQAIVRRSYVEPLLTYETNVLGTANVLEAVAATSSISAIVVVTSDKVYRQDGLDRQFRETDHLGGDDPYSASKACAENVAAEWRRRTPRVATATARAGNVVGGGDRAQDRLLPDVVRAVESGAPAAIRNPAATRPWQHAVDALSGYLTLGAALLRGDETPPAVNFGPVGSAPVAEVLDEFIGHLGAGEWVLETGEQPHEDLRLALDASLAADALGWRSRVDLSTTLAWTAEWYRAQLEGRDLLALTLEQIARYADRP